MALIKVKGVNTKDDGGLHNNLRQYKTYDFALSEVHYWDRYLNQILCFDKKYEKTATTSSAPSQPDRTWG
ncbi:hypothetical protein ACHAQJ_006196 [Trichoderma viride]